MEDNRACLLVAIDFSNGALRALREGRSLANRTGLDVRILQVLEKTSAWPPDALEWDWLMTAPVASGESGLDTAIRVQRVRASVAGAR